MAAKGSSGGGFGDDHDEASNHSRDKKRYRRHTTDQIQLLEKAFKECPYPDKQTRSQLSREMGLDPGKIKFWFQNRRSQQKAKSERIDNYWIREDNDKIRSENIAINEALKNAMCATCGGPPCSQGDCHEEQRLRSENAQLEKELGRVSSILAKYIGRPLISQFSPVKVQQSQSSSLDISMPTFAGATQQRSITMASGEPSLDLNFPTTVHIVASASTIPPSNPLHLTDKNKSLIADISTSALEELMRLFQTNEPLWTKSVADGRDVLDINSYELSFPRPNASKRNLNVWIEASRATAELMMNSMQLVEMFKDSAKWGDLFPTIVLKAKTIEVVSSNTFGSQSGYLQLMYEELQVASPLVPIRRFNIIRSCRQIDQVTWAVVDVTYDLPQEDGMPYFQSNSRRLPSGCLIQSMPNGYSKVTWIEHLEIEEKTAVHRLYRDLVHSGLAFGAERWVACLQRSCERIFFQTVTNSSDPDFGGVIPLSEGRKSVMKLAQKMVKDFCASSSPYEGNLWSSVSDFDDFEVHTTLYKSSDPDHQNTMILGAAATVWLPHSPQLVFDFLRDQTNRLQWDELVNDTPIEEVTHIANGANPGNCISVLRAQNNNHANILILQESCTDSSGSLLVYCPIELPSINKAMSWKEPAVSVPFLSSGFAITTDGQKKGGGAASTGSLVTLVLRMVVSLLPSGKLSGQSVGTINNLIGCRVREIKAALRSRSTST